MAIEWRKEYSMNVVIIDSQHKHFIEILNKLYAAIYIPESRSDLGKILDELIAYAVEHFDTEEKYFDEFDYPLKVEHKMEHEAIKVKLLDFKNNFINGKVDITTDLIDFVEDWLVHHLEMQDKKYSKFFNEHGLY